MFCLHVCSTQPDCKLTSSASACPGVTGTHHHASILLKPWQSSSQARETSPSPPPSQGVLPPAGVQSRVPPRWWSTQFLWLFCRGVCHSPPRCLTLPGAGDSGCEHWQDLHNPEWLCLCVSPQPAKYTERRFAGHVVSWDGVREPVWFPSPG